MLGIIADWVTPYVRPQENANRTDVRWCELRHPQQSGLRIVAGRQLLGISVWPYTAADLENTPHQYKLPRRDSITVNVDGAQMGVGGDSSWGLPVHPEYRILTKGWHELYFELHPCAAL